MVCRDGLFPRYLPMVCSVELEHQAQGKNNHLCLTQSWYNVSTIYAIGNLTRETDHRSAGICGVVRTTGLDALNKTSDYLCKSS